MSQVLPKPNVLTDPLDIILKGYREPDFQEQLYKKLYPDMIRICHRYAGDMDGAGTIFNNAMLRVFKNLGNYSMQGKFRAWVTTIVINCCIDFVKQQNKFREHVTNTIDQHEVDVPAEVLSMVSAKEIRELIRQLPKATAVVFNLYVYEGFTHKQVAERLGISEGTSKWHINEGRRLLKSKLELFINKGVTRNAAG